jgi:hypothetical protein
MVRASAYTDGVKRLTGIGALILLVAGCGVSNHDVIGVYRLNVDGQQGSLELKSDATYLQTLRLSGQPEETRTGRWEFGKWRTSASSPGHFQSDADSPGGFVFLERGAAIEHCPRCRAVSYDLIPLAIQAGMMDIFLVDDPKAGIAYAK